MVEIIETFPFIPFSINLQEDQRTKWGWKTRDNQVIPLIGLTPNHARNIKKIMLRFKQFGGAEMMQKIIINQPLSMRDINGALKENVRLIRLGKASEGEGDLSEALSKALESANSQKVELDTAALQEMKEGKDGKKDLKDREIETKTVKIFK